MRAGGWWHGASLSFDAPPLAQLRDPASADLDQLIEGIKEGGRPNSLWLVGPEGIGKTALVAYLAQQLYPGELAAAERTGDLLAHLRWLGAVKGEGAVELRLERLVTAPLLVLDDIDRPVRSHTSLGPFAFRESCSATDLIRLATLLRERAAADKPIVVTSRVHPREASGRVQTIEGTDLVRGLTSVALGEADPFGDFPVYLENFVSGAFNFIAEDAAIVRLGPTLRPGPGARPAGALARV